MAALTGKYRLNSKASLFGKPYVVVEVEEEWQDGGMDISMAKRWRPATVGDIHELSVELTTRTKKEE